MDLNALCDEAGAWTGWGDRGSEPQPIGEVLAELFAVYEQRFPENSLNRLSAGIQPEGSSSCPPAAEASQQASQAAHSAGPMTRMSWDVMSAILDHRGPSGVASKSGTRLVTISAGNGTTTLGCCPPKSTSRHTDQPGFPGKWTLK